MPVSKRSPRRRASRGRVPPAAPKRSAGLWRKRLGWPLVVMGAVLFVLGNIGARTGIVFLPFDPHHVFEQFGGAVVAIVGLIWATGR